MINSTVIFLMFIGVILIIALLDMISTKKFKIDWTGARKRLERPINKYSDKDYVLGFYFNFITMCLYGAISLMAFLRWLSIYDLTRYSYITLIFITLGSLFVAMLYGFILIEYRKAKKYYPDKYRIG